MMEKLRALDLHYADVEARLSAPETYEDPALVARLNKEQRELEPVVMAYRAYQRRRQDLEDAEALMGDPDMKELAQEEYQQAREELARLEEEIKVLLLPRDPNDDKNVIVEIRAGVGGEEAALFAHSLFRMYSMYAESRRWKTEVASLNMTELGGVKEISFTIEGDGAWSRMKFESGVHRVQRVPETESGGRIHTSTATVAVLPEVERWTSSSTRRTSRCRFSAPPVRAASTSTRPPPLCGSSTSPPARWWSASRSAASSRTGTGPCRSCAPVCTRRRCGSRRRR